jgi:hypothetical protein
VAWEFHVHEVGSVAFVFGGVAHGVGVLSTALALSRCGCSLLCLRVRGWCPSRCLYLSVLVAV